MSIQEIIIVVLIAALVFLIGINFIDKHDINSLTAKLATCELSIQEQDAAIKAESAKDAKIQQAVNQAEQSNATLTKTEAKEIQTISLTPDITACDQAIKWGANQAMLSAASWQTTAILTST